MLLILEVFQQTRGWQWMDGDQWCLRGRRGAVRHRPEVPISPSRPRWYRAECRKGARGEAMDGCYSCLNGTQQELCKRMWLRKEGSGRHLRVLVCWGGGACMPQHTACSSGCILHGQLAGICSLLHPWGSGESNSGCLAWLQAPLATFTFYFYFFKLDSFHFVCALQTRMYGHHVCAWYSWRSEERNRGPRTTVMDGCEPPCGC